MKEPNTYITLENIDLEPLQRLTRDIAKSTAIVGQQQARYLVDTYYAMQEGRIASASRVRDLTKDGEPAAVMDYTRAQMELLEGQVARALKWYVEAQPLGVWMTSVIGIGPVIAAGLLSSIDYSTTNSAARIWKFAGLTPDSVWEKGERRPWNAFLKTIAYKIGESFVKMQSNESDFYGRFYAYRKALEWKRNIRGELADQAAAKLDKYNLGKGTNAYQWYTGRISPEWVAAVFKSGESFPANVPANALNLATVSTPMLPPAHIHARARRWTAKLFLAHTVEVGHWLHHGRLAPPEYAFAHLGHKDYVYPPCLEVVEQLRPGLTAALYERHGPVMPHNQRPAVVYFGEQDVSVATSAQQQ
jgi:hypothetical protein